MRTDPTRPIPRLTGACGGGDGHGRKDVDGARGEEAGWEGNWRSWRVRARAGAREGQSFCAAELQSDGPPLVSFEGEGTEHVGCLVAPSLARLKSFHHSLARSRPLGRPRGRRTSSLPLLSSPPPSLATITRLRLSTPAVLAVKWVVVCLQERWAIPAAQTFPPVTKGRPPKTKGRCRLLLTLHSSLFPLQPS